MDALKLIEQGSMKAEAPKIEIGDLVKVHVKIKEGEKFRIQVFEGTVIAKKHGSATELVRLLRLSPRFNSLNQIPHSCNAPLRRGLAWILRKSMCNV